MMLEIIYLYGYQDYNGKRVLSSVAGERDVTVAPLYAESKVTEIYCIVDVICLKFLLRMKIICMTVWWPDSMGCTEQRWG